MTMLGTREAGAGAEATWWRDGVLYQVYPRSFTDSDGDGIGDLRGLIDRLDHLEWLGIDGVWLSPTFPSPNDDWGYDVADYTAVHPELGTLEDMDELIAEARRRGIRILLDLVPNHTSDRHAWFRDALTGRQAAHRDFYVWADPAPGGGPPNNWISNFGGTAWELDEASGQYYLCQFLESDLIALRRERADLRTGGYETVDGPGWVFRRGDGTVVALNLSDQEVAVDVPGTVLVSTDRSLDGAALTRLGPWQGAVVGS